MKWVWRTLALLAACLVAPAVVIVLGVLLLGPVGALLLGPLAFGSVPAAALAGIPGLIVLDRIHASSRWAGLTLGGVVGLVSGVLGHLLTWGSEDGFGSTPSLTLLGILPGIPCGILGAAVYWYVNGWFENQAARAAADRKLARMSEEDRRELGSRVDRDRW
jgi:hypothetical protein